MVRLEGALVVVAHLSEGIPRFWLLDNGALETFLENELQYGLQVAVEAKVLADVTPPRASRPRRSDQRAGHPAQGPDQAGDGWLRGPRIVLHPADWEGVDWRCRPPTRWSTCPCPMTRPPGEPMFGVP